MYDKYKIKFKAKRKHHDGEAEGYYFYDKFRNKHFIHMQDLTGMMRESEIDENTLRIVHNEKDFKQHSLIGNVVHECLSTYVSTETNKLNTTKKEFHKLYDEYSLTIEDQRKNDIWEMIMTGIKVINDEKNN